MDDLINAFKAQMYEKARSPFLTAFLFSWSSWNLKTLIVIFSNGDVKTKLELINQLYPNIVFYGAQWVLYPSVSAGLFILIYPWIARVAFTYWNGQNNKIKLIQVTQDDQVPATAEDARRLRKLISDVSIEKQKIIDDLVVKNSELMEKTDSVNDIVAQLESQKRDISKELEARELTLSDLTTTNKALEDQLAAITQERVNNLTTALSQAESEIKLTSLLSELDVEIDSLSEKDKENTTKLLKLFLNIQAKFNLKVEQLKVLATLIAYDGKTDIQKIERAMKVEELKLNAILNSLKDKNLISYDLIFSGEVTITNKFKTEIYEIGILSIPNYLTIIEYLFLKAD